MTDSVASQKSSAGLLVDKQSHTGGIDEYLHFDDGEGVFARELVQDVEPVLRDAHERAMEPGAGKNKAGDFYHAGRFPLVLVHAWLNQRHLTMQEFKGDVLKEFLNDDSHKAFRIWQGRV